MGYYLYYSIELFPYPFPHFLQYILGALSESAYPNWLYFGKLASYHQLFTPPEHVGCFQVLCYYKQCNSK